MSQLRKELTMAKKTKNAEITSNTQEDPESAPPAETLHRVTVLVSEADLLSIREAFAQDRTAQVTVHMPRTRELTDAQREKRKTYRQRPEVREKHKAYRALLAKRIRVAAKAQEPTSGE
jgi:hypothetical protein